VAILIACLSVVVAVACGSSKADDDVGVIITPIVDANMTAPNGTPASSVPGSHRNGSLATLTDFAWPVAGGCLPRGDQLMPNAPRPYRNGVHEGVDFYPSDNCTLIARGTPVLAAKPGAVIRADLDYKDITAAEVAKYEANPNTEEALDSFRGRQVWVDHGVDANGNRIITRYCHLSAIAPGISKGVQVSKGQQIASVGESGTPESVVGSGSELHLHFEIRVGDGYLGKALPRSEVRALYVAAFGP
jgi:murein DD-endopeptidase MepM/ murein hydrolase activator NlpD